MLTEKQLKAAVATSDRILEDTNWALDKLTHEQPDRFKCSFCGRWYMRRDNVTIYIEPGPINEVPSHGCCTRCRIEQSAKAGVKVAA